MRARLLVFVLASGLAACAALTGLGDFEITAGTADSGSVRTLPDGAVIHPGSDASPIVDGASFEGEAAADAAPACPAAVAAGAAVLASKVSTGTISVDGKDDDWPCTARVLLDATNRGGVYEPSATITTSGVFAAACSADGLYLLGHVSGPNALAQVSTSVLWENDAVEFYLAPATDPTGKYSASAVHIVIDYTGEVAFYNSSSAPPSTGVTAAATTVAGGYIVEAFFPAAVVGIPMAAGGRIYFDAQIEEHATSSRAAYWIYGYQPSQPTGTCGSSVLQPSCSTGMWGALDFSP